MGTVFFGVALIALTILILVTFDEVFHFVDCCRNRKYRRAAGSGEPSPREQKPQRRVILPFTAPRKRHDLVGREVYYRSRRHGQRVGRVTGIDCSGRVRLRLITNPRVAVRRQPYRVTTYNFGAS